MKNVKLYEQWSDAEEPNTKRYFFKACKEIAELKADNKRLSRILEDKLIYDTEEGNKISASDSYYEIADITGVKEGGSVIETVKQLQAKLDKAVELFKKYLDHPGCMDYYCGCSCEDDLKEEIKEYLGEK